ncbi:PREDICTED: rho GTPase-activating protein 18-like isoform X2 [Priapulus caudatus]|uniref:Rho GTPase-activating protein 18-like isoform X2 n=1 Tax=Priapulus caudatus TaxID=37621 RepID=A0ABM1DSP5_PRICU|nr:PREDICTED: rho GTPase-activating protein 18-like isoform X2 [Priapulus caudatus]
MAGKDGSPSMLLDEIYGELDDDILDDLEPCTPVEDDGGKSTDGDTEMDWLREAGFGTLADRYQEGKVVDQLSFEEEVFMTLSRKQSAAVWRRVHTLNATVRIRQQKHHIHVRDVFNPQEEKCPPATPTTPVRVQDGVLSGTPISYKLDADQKKHEKTWGSFFKHKDAALCPGISDSLSGIIPLSIATAGTDFSDFPLPSISESDIAFDITGGFLENKTEESGFGSKPGDSNDDLPSDDLHNIYLLPEPLGVTRVGYLGPSDMKRVQTLALIELTALFDQYNISYCHIKKKRHRNKDSILFGVPLTTIVERDQRKQPDIKVPLVLNEMTQFLEANGIREEGILRVPGSAVRTRQLKSELESSHTNGDVQWSSYGWSDVAGLLKKWLRELPVPLLTYEYVQAFAAVQTIPIKKQQVQALNFLMLVLPKVHRDTLKLFRQRRNKVDYYKKAEDEAIKNVMEVVVESPACCHCRTTVHVAVKHTKDHTTVASVLKKLCDSTVRRDDCTEHAMYEVGGNIDFRRLEPDTGLQKLFLENPMAKWEVRCLCPPLCEKL